MVATPVAGGVVAHEYMHSVMSIEKHFAALGWSMQFVTQPDGLVTRSRNAFASTVVRSDEFTHLLMLDADVTVSPEGIERLVRSGYDLAGCVVPLRQVNWDSVRNHLDQLPKAPAEEMRAVANKYALWTEPKQKAVSGFIPVKAIGSAVMLISRSALVELSESDQVQKAEHGLHAVDGQESGWTFFDPFVDDRGVYLSEDYAICQRWRSLGGQVWADLETKTRHIGPVSIEGDIKSSLSAAKRFLTAKASSNNS